MTAVLANSPVSFTEINTGKQMSIPLSDIYFDSSGAIKADKWPPYTPGSSTFKGQVDAWLQYLVKKGDLVKDTQAPVSAAMVVEAQQAGATGNSVRLVVSNVHEVSGTDVFDATVTETNTYTGLTPATIKNVIGTSAGGGTQPGLVFVSSGTAPTMPGAVADKVLAALPAATEIKEADGTTTAFELKPKGAGADVTLTKVTIKDVDTTASTFTLVAVWTKSATNILPSAMSTAFGYELAITAPTGGTLAVPAPGAYVLSGGADAQGPQKASAVLAAKQ